MMNTQLRPNIDTDNDPINRIFKEPLLFSDENVVVVLDKDPIVNKHYLILTKNRFDSFADLAKSDNIYFNFEKVTKELRIKDLSYFEKGRAKFCTSMKTHSHAHTHIFDDSLIVNNILINLCSSITVKTFGSYKDAIEYLIHTTGEYLIFGDVNECHVALNKNEFSSKRFIRTFISQNYRNS